MTKFTDRLWSDLAQEHGTTLAQAGRSRSGRSRRPGLIAGGTLALAVGGTALALGLTANGGGSADIGGTRVVTDAYTITQSGSGPVLVQINNKESIIAANAKLTALINEEVVVASAAGPATTDGPVTCTPGEPNMGGPTVKVLLGADGTQVITPGTTGGNTGVGTWHLTSCQVYPTADMGTGGTGTGS
jgi:hypothetical protein